MSPGFASSHFHFLILVLVVSLTLPALRAQHDDDEQIPVPSEQAVPEQVIQYRTPDLEQENLPHKFYEHFDDELLFNRRWIKSQATKSESQESQYDGEWGLVPSHVRVPGQLLQKLIICIPVSNMTCTCGCR